MRKFIIISLLSAMTLPTLACIWGELTNPYLFSMYRRTEFKERVEKICNDNWQAYLGTSEEYFWFNADDVHNSVTCRLSVPMRSVIPKQSCAHSMHCSICVVT